MTHLIEGFRNCANWPRKRSIYVLILTLTCVGIRIRRENFDDVYSITTVQIQLIAAHDKFTLWREQVYGS